MRLIERFFQTRPRKIRRDIIGAQSCVACPMVDGFLRLSHDCQSCEYNLGERPTRVGAPLQLCGYGRKARQVPRWILKIRELLQRIPMPKPQIQARFQWRRRGERQMSAIQRRQLERRRTRERERAKRLRARELRERTLAERNRRQLQR